MQYGKYFVKQIHIDIALVTDEAKVSQSVW